MADENVKKGFISKLIETVAHGVGVVYEPTNIRRIAKAKADEIRLEDAGLIANSANVSETFRLERGQKKDIFLGNDVVVVTLTNNSEKPLDINKQIYLLSEAGREVYNVVHRDKVDVGKSEYYKLVENYFYRDDIQELWDGLDEL